jgi:hypothetical protein
MKDELIALGWPDYLNDRKELTIVNGVVVE